MSRNRPRRNSFHTISHASESQAGVFRYGFPVPGQQSPTVEGVMDADYLVDDCEWQQVIERAYDYIVVGSGFTGLAFAKQVLTEDPHARVLMLERGPFWLTQHFQDTPLPFKYTLGGPSETFPWTLSEATLKTPVNFMHGSCPFLGGRSTFWSSWSPTPTPELMRGWPPSLVEATRQPGFWSRARDLLNVVSAGEIKDDVYAALQAQLSERLIASYREHVPSADDAFDAPLAVGDPRSGSVRFSKYSVPGPLLELHETQASLAKAGHGSPFEIATRCVVERLLSEPSGRVTAIQTSRGELPVGDARVVLSMGVVPATTLLLNSFPTGLANAGGRLTGHFLTHIAARVPRSAFKDLPDALQIGAMYLSGKNPAQRQYHVQVTAVAAPHPDAEALDAARECPDYAAAATPQQLADSQDHVVFVCASLGELDEANPLNWVRPNAGEDPTTNVTLQVLPSAEDFALWDLMDAATVQTIEAMAASSPLEYWHDEGAGKGSWSAEALSPQERRVPGLVHEAACLWMGTDPTNSVVGLDYRPHGVQNVYLTGAGLFPSSGSWNPTLTMCGLAQHLASMLVGA